MIMERCEERKASVIQTVRDVVTRHFYIEDGYILFVKTEVFSQQGEGEIAPFFSHICKLDFPGIKERLLYLPCLVLFLEIFAAVIWHFPSKTRMFGHCSQLWRITKR